MAEAGPGGQGVLSWWADPAKGGLWQTACRFCAVPGVALCTVGPAQLVHGDGCKGCADAALITLPAQSASRGAAAGGTGGTPSGTDSSRLARRRGGASEHSRPHSTAREVGAPLPSPLCSLPSLASKGKGDLGGWWHLLGLDVGPDCSRLSPGAWRADWVETLLSAVGVAQVASCGAWAWW